MDKCSQANQVEAKIGAVVEKCNQVMADAVVNRRRGLCYQPVTVVPPIGVLADLCGMIIPRRLAEFGQDQI